MIDLNSVKGSKINMNLIIVLYQVSCHDRIFNL